MPSTLNTIVNTIVSDRACQHLVPGGQCKRK
jgi:hypothetical protein